MVVVVVVVMMMMLVMTMVVMTRCRAPSHRIPPSLLRQVTKDFAMFF
jgi:hypothetical protein